MRLGRYAGSCGASGISFSGWAGRPLLMSIHWKSLDASRSATPRLRKPTKNAGQMRYCPARTPQSLSCPPTDLATAQVLITGEVTTTTTRERRRSVASSQPTIPSHRRLGQRISMKRSAPDSNARTRWTSTTFLQGFFAECTQPNRQSADEFALAKLVGLGEEPPRRCPRRRPGRLHRRRRPYLCCADLSNPHGNTAAMNGPKGL